jgi:hypothetical protein
MANTFLECVSEDPVSLGGAITVSSMWNEKKSFAEAITSFFVLLNLLLPCACHTQAANIQQPVKIT